MEIVPKGPVCRIWSMGYYPTATGWQEAIQLRAKVRKEILQCLGEPDLAGEYASIMMMELTPPEKCGIPSSGIVYLDKGF